MLEIFTTMPLKKQMLAALHFVIGYFSPIAGLILALIYQFRRQESLYKISTLSGAGMALVIYVISFML